MVIGYITGFALFGVLLRYLWRLASGEDTKRQYGLEHHRITALSKVEIARAQAMAAVAPQTLHYAPHIAVSGHSNSGETAEVLPGDTSTQHTIPTFADLLTAGTLSQQRADTKSPLILGYDLATNSLVNGAWLDIYSSALAGMPHSGKTTSQRFLACQLALLGSRFVVCDPHMGAGDDSLAETLQPLSSRYLCDAADTPESILQSIRYVESIGHSRVQGNEDRTPVVLWVDELNGLLQDDTVGKPLVKLLQDTARQYRKVGVFINAVAHTWTASSTGGNSDLRANFASRMVHRMERGQAQRLVPTSMAQRAETLEPGQAILHSMRHSTVVQVPETTASDVVSIAGLLTDDQPVIQSINSHEFVTNQSYGNVENTSQQSRKLRTAEEETILALFLAGKDTAQIVKDVYDMNSRSGKPYMVKLSEVQSVIRDAMKEGSNTTCTS